jgi:hypothetical protein
VFLTMAELYLLYRMWSWFRCTECGGYAGHHTPNCPRARE